MAKIITLTDEKRNELLKEFETMLQTAKFSDGKINYTKTFGVVDRKATLYFTPKAYVKMLELVRVFDKEIAWNGIAQRFDGENEDGYLIRDIFVFPQRVTGATVTTDQEAYEAWLYQRDDEDFNNIRMQGHSHVNMGVTPSSVDLALYDDILSQLTPDSFYIFLIWNKRQEKTIKIYDMKKNILFETPDVTVNIVDEDFCLDSFIATSKSMVKDNVQTYTVPKTQVSTGIVKTANVQTVPASPKQTTVTQLATEKKTGTKKKKKWKATNPSVSTYSTGKYSAFNYYEDDDDDDSLNPYGAFGWR